MPRQISLALIALSAFNPLLSGAIRAAVPCSADSTAIAIPEPPLATGTQVIIPNDWMKTKNGFSAQFWVTDRERFFLNWVHSDTRNLIPVFSTKRGVRLLIAIFAVGMGDRAVTNADGKVKHSSDVTYDFNVKKPDNSDAAEGKDVTGWMGKSQPHLVQLLYGRPSLFFEATDPSGEYTITVAVHDNVRKVDVTLIRKLVLMD